MKERIITAPLESVFPNSYNPNRMPEELYKALVEDVRQNGINAIDPILVRTADGGFEIIDGYHRWKAAGECGFSKIRARVQEVSETDARAICYRKNRERGTLDPFREAELFLHDHLKMKSTEKWRGSTA